MNASEEVQVTEDTKSSTPDVGGTASQAEPPKGKVKLYLALTFMLSFLGLIGLAPYILLFFGKINVNDYKDIVLTLSGILSGPFGIIINNYFKEGQD